MNILLVRPNTPKDSINLQSFMICEPLELEYLASALINENHNVDLIDMLLEKKPLKHFLKQKKYDMVCFTAYITTVGMVKEYAKSVKEYDSSILTAIGGVHAEVVPNDFVDKNIDYILWANGVMTLLEITRKYPNINKEEISGLYLDENSVKPQIVNGNLLKPNREITAKYRDHYNYIFHNKCATIKTSYGCPYKCSFCFCTKVCDYSVRHLEDVLDELEQIKEDNVFIVDDDFLVSKERMKAFCDGLDKRNIKKHYIAFGRADFIAENEETIIMLKEHGFDAFFVGIESFKKEELNSFSKKTSVEINIAAVDVLERNGVQCYSGLIVGEDWVKDDFDTLINYLNTFKSPMVNIQPITPMPGTPLFDNYPIEITESREIYAHWDMAHVVYKPLKMSKRKFYYHIIRAYLKTVASKRIRQFIKNKYGKDIYRRVRRGASKIFFQYLKLMIMPN